MNFLEAATRGVLWEKLFLKKSAIFTGKLQVCNSIKKRLQHKCFPLSIAKFLRTPILKNICFSFFKTAAEQRWAAPSLLTFFLSSDNLFTGYEQLSY